MKFIIELSGNIYEDKFYPSDYYKNEEAFWRGKDTNRDIYYIISTRTYKYITKRNFLYFSGDIHPDTLISLFRTVFVFENKNRKYNNFFYEMYEKKEDCFYLKILGYSFYSDIVNELFIKFKNILINDYNCIEIPEFQIPKNSIGNNFLIEIGADSETRHAIETALIKSNCSNIAKLDWSMFSEINGAGADETIHLILNLVYNADLSIVQNVLKDLFEGFIVAGLNKSVLSIFNKLKKGILDINKIRTQLINDLSIDGEIADANPSVTYREDIITFHFIEYKERKPLKYFYVIIDTSTGEKEYHVTDASEKYLT